MTPNGWPRPRALRRTLLIVAVGVLPLFVLAVLSPDSQHWMIDLQVYREAGVSNLVGRPVYEHLTDRPQSLPFTYPPFASLLAIPLALLPFRVVGVLWFVAQVGAAVALTRLTGAGLLSRAGHRAPWVWALLTLAVLYTLPAADGLRFGQVNAFLVLACLVDVLRPQGRWFRALPQGVLVGLATAIKLTPGVFLIYFLLTRQWRAAATAIGTAAGVTLVMFVLLPGPSLDFWGGALHDSERLGRNDGTSNQSIRGVLLRLGPGGRAEELLWLAAVLAVLVIGYATARRAFTAGDRLLAFAAVGNLGVLISPVSWIHHFHWVLPALFVLAQPRHPGTGLRAQPWRLAAVAAAWGVLVFHVPWWGHWRLVDEVIFEPADSTGHPFWTVLHNSYTLVALITLLALAARARALGATLHRPASAIPARRRSPQSAG